MCLVGIALAGDAKAYNGAFCQPLLQSSDHRRFPHMYEAREPHVVTCPIIRDEVEEVQLPKVLIEAWVPSAREEDLQCSVYWMEEDGGPLLRGWSFLKSTGNVGKVQIAFESLSDFAGYGVQSLTAGGEGSLSILCQLEQLDGIIQYYVLENQY